MITGWQLYWLTRLDAISSAFQFLTGLFGVLFAICLFCVIVSFAIGWCENEPEALEFGKRMIKPAIIISTMFVLFIGAKSFTPTTKEMVAFIAVPKIINNEDVQEIPPNVAKFMNEKLKSWMEDNLSDVKDVIPTEDSK